VIRFWRHLLGRVVNFNLMADKPTESSGGGLNPILWLLLVLIGLFVFWVAGGGPERARQEKQDQGKKISSGTSVNFWQPLSYPSEMPTWGLDYWGGSSVGGGRHADVEPVDERGQKVSDSVWRGQVYLGRGNLTATDLNQEYIVVRNEKSPNPVNITGWKLISPKTDARAVQYSVIPFGALVLLAKPTLGPIMLEPKARAYVVSGVPLGSNPFRINSSFKENKCLGYLERLDNYKFRPGFPSHCPDLRELADPEDYNDSCYNFLSGLGCRTIKWNETFGEWQACGVTISENIPNWCFDKVKKIANYESCVSTHQTNDDFLGKDWYVFLDRRYEFWPDRRGRVILLDQFGRLVDQLVY